MREVFVVAVGCTPFGKHTDTTLTQLAETVVAQTAGDFGESECLPVESVWFGSAFTDRWGQANIRGQAILSPLMEHGLLAERLPITNVEGACATGAYAFRGAVSEVRSGEVEVALAIGVEKMHLPAGTSIFEALSGCAENLQTGRLENTYRTWAQAYGRPWNPDPCASLFLETYSVQARLHMAGHDVTSEQIAIACAKTHNYAALNPLARFRFPMTSAEVLADRQVTDLFTRAMCSPITDGAAAVVVCSADWLSGQSARVQRRAVRVGGIGVASGSYGRGPQDPTVSRTAARKAYAQAGIQPSQVDLVELHDATSYAEIFQLEMLELCAAGDGAKLAESGQTGPGGTLPVNTSGGLVAKGHPVGATGLSMIQELTTQLRHEAGERQVDDARVGLAENGGGVLGLEEATCVVTVLEAVR